MSTKEELFGKQLVDNNPITKEIFAKLVGPPYIGKYEVGERVLYFLEYTMRDETKVAEIRSVMEKNLDILFDKTKYEYCPEELSMTTYPSFRKVG